MRASIRDAGGVEKISADHGEEDAFSITVPAGDLNGDNKDDAVDVFDTKLDAVRGTDGGTLWSRPFQGWGGYLGDGKLDSTPGDDLLVLEVQEQDLTAGWRWTIRVVALAGTTGNAIWTRTYENVWTIGGLGSSELYVDLDLSIPWATGEISGDAAKDLLVGRLDVAAVSTNVASRGSMAAIFEAISGSNGQVVAAYPGTGRDGGFADAAVVPTLTGDAADDVVVASVARTATARSVNLAAYPGKGGAPAWRRDLTLYSHPGLQGLRLNADTTSDVLVTNTSGVGTSFALNGTNGSSLWSQALGRDAWVRPAGDVTGDGGQDLIVIEDADVFGGGILPPVPATGSKDKLNIPELPGHEGSSTSGDCYGYGYGYDCGPYIEPPCNGSYGYGGGGYGYGGGGCPAIYASLLRGNNGQSLWSEFSYGWAEPVGDATGDGIGDVLVDGYVVDENEEAYEPMAFVLSGVNGEAAWQRPPAEHEYLTAAGADLDGDPGADLIGLRFEEEDAYRVVSGATGEAGWDDYVATGGWLFYLAPARLDGSGTDLVETVLNLGSWTTDGVGRNGADGERIWHR